MTQQTLIDVPIRTGDVVRMKGGELEYLVLGTRGADEVVLTRAITSGLRSCLVTKAVDFELVRRGYGITDEEREYRRLHFGYDFDDEDTATRADAKTLGKLTEALDA